ncbi:MAG: YciI family protein [Rhodocyclaceae bacterium]
MKTLMFYEMAADAMSKVQAHYADHVARLHEFKARGTLLMAGPYGMPPVGALGVFTTREAAEEFAKDDPFVVHGIVGRYTLHDWNEVLAV